MSTSRTDFLMKIKEYSKNNPDMAKLIIISVMQGLDEKIKEETERANDMEVVSMAFFNMSTRNKKTLTKHRKYLITLAESKLNKWKDFIKLNWPNLIEFFSIDKKDNNIN